MAGDIGCLGSGYQQAQCIELMDKGLELIELQGDTERFLETGLNSWEFNLSIELFTEKAFLFPKFYDFSGFRIFEKKTTVPTIQ
jgi:hypothetical protein